MGSENSNKLYTLRRLGNLSMKCFLLLILVYISKKYHFQGKLKFKFVFIFGSFGNATDVLINHNYVIKRRCTFTKLSTNKCFTVIYCMLILLPNLFNRHDITEILLKVALNTITLTLEPVNFVNLIVFIEISICYTGVCALFNKILKSCERKKPV
jgi:hypothetical protein